MYHVPWLALFSANRWCLNVLTFLIKGFVFDNKNVNIHILSLQFFDSMDVLPHTLTHGLLLEIQFSFQTFLLMHLHFHEIFMNCSQYVVLKIEDFSRENVGLWKKSFWILRKWSAKKTLNKHIVQYWQVVESSGSL